MKLSENRRGFAPLIIVFGITAALFVGTVLIKKDEVLSMLTPKSTKLIVSGNSVKRTNPIQYRNTTSKNPTSTQKTVTPKPQTLPIINRPVLPPGQFYIDRVNAGQSIVVNGVQYEIVSARNLGSDLSNSGYGYAKSNGGKYIVVNFVATNVSKDEVSLTNIRFSLIDSLGRNYRRISGISDGISMSSSEVGGYHKLVQNDFDGTSLKPGFKTKLFILSEVAADSKGLGILIGNQSDQNFVVPLGI